MCSTRGVHAGMCCCKFCQVETLAGRRGFQLAISCMDVHIAKAPRRGTVTDKKKAGKFQPFKKLFGKRKKREASSECEEAKLKPSHSFGNVYDGTSSPSSSSDEEPNGGLRSSHYSMGSRAFSHDSIFIPDGRTESEQAIQAMSQENVLGKVKTLQQQLGKNIKFGQPPQMTISVRTMGEANTGIEEDVLLSSPMEIETQQQDTLLSDGGNKSTKTPETWRTMNLPGTGHELEEKVPPVKSSRPKRQFSCSGTIETINLDSVPQAVARLDNSAAKHKLAVKPKKQRMSRKHKRLTKGSQSLTITEFEPEDLEPELYGDRYPGYNGHIIADKLIQTREEQKQIQLAEEKRIEDHWGILEAERIRQIVEMEEQKEMEEQRCQELEQMKKEQERRHCEDERKQYVLGGETTLETEEQTCHKEERRLLQDGKRQELEKQREKELEEQHGQELEEQKHREWEEQQRQELEKQRNQKEEEQKRRELEEQRHQKQKEQQRQELEEQRQWEWQEQQRQELEEQKHQEWEKQQRQELEDQKHQEWVEQQRQELEEQKHQEWVEQQRQELEEQKHQEWVEKQRQELEEQKRQEQEERKRRELEVQRQKEWEEQQRQELEEQKHQEWVEQQRKELEEQKHQEWVEQQRKELEEQKHQEEEKQRRQELEEQKHQEWEEQRCEELEEKQRQELEEHKRLQQKELRQHETEKQYQEEEEGKWLKEQKELNEQNKEEKQRQELEEEQLQGAEIKIKLEKEAESLRQQKKQEEQKPHLKEKGEKIENDRPHQVMDKKNKLEEQRKRKLTKQMHMESSDAVLQDELKQQKEQNEQEWNKLEEKEVNTEGQNLQQTQPKKLLEQQQDEDQLHSGGADQHPVEENLQGSKSPNLKQPEKGNKTAEEVLAQKLKREVEAQEQKRIGEELRWQEVDERQTTSRPFTFQVSSGDKQIIFQKVNLSPVMPVKGAGLSSPSTKDYRMHTSSNGSHTLPSSVCVPHTAILVTGAQLCGTAVNLNQIKDTACKSLLGLTEERKTVDIPSPEKAQKKKQDPKPSSSKMKYAQETLNNQAVLAEWASIRSRILKNAENGKYNERVSVCRHSDDWTPRGRGGPHGNLRKTLSANAKFSITPAWQKFSEASKANSAAENVSAAKGSETVAMNRITGSSTASQEDVASTLKNNVAEKSKEKMETHSEMADNTEGCKYAKDLPSFLVPSFPHSPGKELPQAELPSAVENQQNNSTKTPDKPDTNGEENVSPFGIKLRRTNYSLRFHYDQQAEQRKKKRYSAGDSFDGVPDPLGTAEGEKESTVFAPQENTSPGMGRVNVPDNLKDSRDSPVNVLEASQSVGSPVVLPATAQSALPPAIKSLAPQKPALAPKPTSQTPPPSPLSKMNRSNLADALGQRLVKAESDGGWKKEDTANAVHATPSNEYKNEEEEIREKKSFFPSLSIPWREKNEKKPEPLKKEKPVLQSRHSLDGSKLMEKVETSQPLWITLALQKQKGFREQQATREERRQAREAKQAEKLAREMAAASHQSDNKSNNSKTSTLQKSTTQEGEKKIETAVSRLERREQLKKSNTLPTSVTVEISDSVPSTPLAKEVAKRFSTPDANPVSTEPAWLALAKRKAKAWSDCPQIIK